MKSMIICVLALVATASAQMEKRDRELYEREAFRKRAPAVGKSLPNLVLRNLAGKKIDLRKLGKKPLVIIAGAYT